MSTLRDFAPKYEAPVNLERFISDWKKIIETTPEVQDMLQEYVIHTGGKEDFLLSKAFLVDHVEKKWSTHSDYIDLYVTVGGSVVIQEYCIFKMDDRKPDHFKARRFVSGNDAELKEFVVNNPLRQKICQQNGLRALTIIE